MNVERILLAILLWQIGATIILFWQLGRVLKLIDFSKEDASVNATREQTDEARNRLPKTGE